MCDRIEIFWQEPDRIEENLTGTGPQPYLNRIDRFSQILTGFKIFRLKEILCIIINHQ